MELIEINYCKPRKTLYEEGLERCKQVSKIFSQEEFDSYYYGIPLAKPKPLERFYAD